MKICKMCSTAHQTPIRQTLRKCPKCGTKGFFAPAPAEMVEAYRARRAATEALIQSLIAEGD